MALLLFFGKLAGLAGARKREWPLEGETCSVRDDCLSYALTIREQHGIWGGLSESERRELLTV